jgi:hypothetical protein
VSYELESGIPSSGAVQKNSIKNELQTLSVCLHGGFVVDAIDATNVGKMMEKKLFFS